MEGFGPKEIASGRPFFAAELTGEAGEVEILLPASHQSMTDLRRWRYSGHSQMSEPQDNVF